MQKKLKAKASKPRPKAPKFSESPGEKQNRAKRIMTALKANYPDAKCSLDYKTPFQLLIATILSAQCTDARVNMTTPALFARFPGPSDFAGADVGEVESLIRSTGFYKNKARNIIACSKAIVEKHGGDVPQTMDELHALGGVGRKTANVVLGNAFGVPSMVVDTHVTRLSNRMGLAFGENAVKLEQDLMKVIEKKDWSHSSHLMISHGRAICTARKALCVQCDIAKLCPKIGV